MICTSRHVSGLMRSSPNLVRGLSAQAAPATASRKKNMVLVEGVRTPFQMSSTTYKDHSKVSTLYFNSLETDKSVMKSISNKVQLATYLISNEYGRKGSFKASLYGLGGMAEKHSDAYGIEDEAWLAASTMSEDYKLFFKTAGDIVATAIFYLSDLPLGGGTYFCSKNAEEVILPKKGSAVVWTNLDSSGLRDKLQDHGGCPVAFSNKFIITQWYNMYYQFNTYPCDIKKSAMFNQQLAYFS